MVRTPCCDKNGMKKGTWTPEEDKKLVAYVSRYGCWNWRQLPKFAGLQRCGKSCRLRWMNYLRPNVKRGNYTKEEEEIIITMHNSLGNRWSSIAAKLPGRTDNEVKNHWHTNLKKRVEQSEPSTQTRDHQESTPLECPTSSSSSSTSSLQETQIEEAEVGPVNAPPSPLNYTPDVLQGLSQLLSPDYQPYPSFDVAAATPSMDDLLSDDSFGFVEAPWSPLWTDSFLGDSFSYETDGFWDPFVDQEMLFAFGSSE